MVDYFCCPSPNPRPEIELNDTTKRYRVVLKTLVYGEIGAVIGHAYLFGLFTAAFHLVHVWIDYMAFATVHPCCVVIMGFGAAMVLLVLFMDASDGGDLYEVIFESRLSKSIFYTMFIFTTVKLLCAFRIYKEFKMAAEGYPSNQLDIDDNF